MKTIIHVIESLVVGGAETLLVNNINALTSYRNIIVILKPINDFETINCDQIICLNHSKKKTKKSVSLLKQIIHDEKADIVHSHLLQADYVARLATSKNIPLFFTVHSRTSDIFSKHLSKYLRERFTYKKRHIPIFVSNDTKQDYASKIRIKGAHYVLYNYINDKYHNASKYKYSFNGERLKIVMVGSLKKIKNHTFIINALPNLDPNKFELHIYGEGSLKDSLLSEIKSKNLESNIFIHDNVTNLEELLPKYDLFVMSSINEGHSLALMEAITLGMPTLISDIPSFRETMEQNTLYFDLENPGSFTTQIETILNTPELLNEYSSKSLKRSTFFNNKSQYISSLSNLYEKHS